MPFPEYKGCSADEIVHTSYTADSAWHVHVALCWFDFAERQGAPQALHYSAYHLRTGIEHLWFDVLFAAQGASMSFAEYDKALEHTTILYKLIDKRSPHYEKFAEFSHIIASLDSRPHPPTIVWDIGKLKRIHGECGHKLLHFQGIPERGYLGASWIGDRSRFLFESASWIFETMRSRGNIVVYCPDGLKKPEVHSLWERYREGKIDAEEARLGLKIIQPIVRKRPHN